MKPPRFPIWLLLMSIWMLSGCGPLLDPFFDGAAPTPEQAVQHAVPVEIRNTLEILGRRDAPGGRVIVVYRTTQPGPEADGMTMLWASLIEPSPGGWEVRGGSAYALPPMITPDTLFTSGTGSGLFGGGGRISIAYGVILETDASEIEVTFTSGETIVDGLEDGFYAAAARAEAVCLIRALDASGAELRRSVIPSLPGDAVAPDNDCPAGE